MTKQTASQPKKKRARSDCKIFIISGPSRAGKESVINAVVRRRSLNLKKIVTATTRERRPYEISGKHFYFFTPEEFQRKIKSNFFLEWAVHSGGRYYGTPMQEIRRARSERKHIILNIDVQGAAQVILKEKNAIRIFIKPDSLQTLKRRMSRAGFSKEQIVARMEDAAQELQEAGAYDYVVVNREGKLGDAVEEVINIIKKELFKN